MAAALPRLSLIIPAHNAAAYLRRTLPALHAAWHQDYELIIVDDASIDETAALAEQAGAQVIKLAQKTGPSGARNAGAQVARGEILAFLDADVEPRPDTLEKLLQSLDQHPDIAAVFGSYDDAPADSRLVSAFKNLMHHYVHQHGETEAETFWTGCGAIRRSVFEQVGPFRKVSIVCIEDIDYGHRLRDSGHRIWLNSDILCKHLKRWTLPGLIRTDVMQRGIPWTVMMLRRGHADSELNLNWVHRLSALLALGVALSALSCFAVVAMATLFWMIAPDNGGSMFRTMGVVSILMGTLASLATAVACVIGLVGIQWDFYRFLSSRRGVVFALASIPLHLLYYWYSAVSLVAGFVVHHTHKSDSQFEV